MTTEQLLEHAAEQWLARTTSWFATASWFTAASWFDYCTATIDWSNFATAGWLSATNWFAARSDIAACIVLVEKLVQQTAKSWAGSAARINNFATTNGCSNFAAADWLATSRSIAATVTQTI